MRLSRFVIVITISSLLGACQPAETNTAPPTSTLSTSATPTQLVTNTRTPSQQATGLPSLTPTVPDRQFLDLPDWMNNPSQNILMYRMLGENSSTDQQSTVHFLNPDTGIEFNLEMPDAFMCWHNEFEVVFIHDPDGDNLPVFLFVLDLHDGSLTRYTEDDTLYKSYYFYTWMCDPHTRQNPPIPKYDHKIITEHNRSTAEIINNQDGTTFILTDPNDGIDDTFVYFAYGYKYISILQINKNSLSSSSPAENQISIFDYSNRKLIVVIQNEDMRTSKFSLDNTKFIYDKGLQEICIMELELQVENCIENHENIYNIGLITNSSDYLIVRQSENEYDVWEDRGDRLFIYDIKNNQEFFSIMDQDINDLRFINKTLEFIFMRGRTTPCIVDILTKSKKCINAIPAQFPSQSIYLGGLRTDGRNLMFTHWSENMGGGLCSINLLTGKITCPTEAISIFNDHVVSSFSLSPDEKYISLIYEYHVCIQCDDRAGGFPNLAVIDLDGNHFIDLGTTNTIQLFLVSSWRPLAVALPTP